eukprot:scaffold256260_cov31-Tisochrysis_lutea.AAC.4
MLRLQYAAPIRSNLIPSPLPSLRCRARFRTCIALSRKSGRRCVRRYGNGEVNHGDWQSPMLFPLTELSMPSPRHWLGHIGSTVSRRPLKRMTTLGTSDGA